MARNIDCGECRRGGDSHHDVVYLLARNRLWVKAALATAAVAVVYYWLSRPIPGLGIAEPVFVPSVTTAIVALLLKTDHRERLGSIWTGVGLGLVASAVTAVVLKTVLGAMPGSREIIEGLTLLVAVAAALVWWLVF